MKLGIVSDTHGHVENTLAAVRMLESLEVDEVLHCGDIGTTAIPKLFARWPTHFVFGNCDYQRDELRQAIQAAGLTCHDRFADLTLAGRRIAVIHSDDGERFRQTIYYGTYDLVCYGHSHMAEFHRVGSTLVLNPGALYRANPHTIALVETATLDVQIMATGR
jgi:putative phosphoesterase